MDLETGEWRSLGRTVAHRTDHTSWLSPEGLMILGGDYGNQTDTEMVSLEDGTSRPSYELHYSGRGACLIPDHDTGSYILTSGSDVSRYDVTGWLESLPEMLQFRNWHGCGSYQTEGGGMKLLVAGGWDIPNFSFLSSVETLTIGDSTWSFAPALPRALAYVVGASVDNKILMVGGSDRDNKYSGQPVMESLTC